MPSCFVVKTGGVGMGLLVFFLALGCSPTADKNERAVTAPHRISLNYSPGTAAAFLAQEKGYFSDQGLETELVPMQDLEAPFEAFTRGEVDACFAILSDIVIQSPQSQRGRIVWMADYSTEGHAIVGDSELKDIAALRGKTIGHHGLNTFSHFFVLESLRQMGVGELEVKYQQVTVTNAVRALEQGEVDAVHCWGREKRRALNAGYQVVEQGYARTGLVAQVLLVATDVIEARDESVEALILGLLMAVGALVESPEKSIAGIASTMGFSEDELRAQLTGVKVLDLKGNIHAFQSLPEMICLPHAIRTIGQRYRERGELTEIPNTQWLVEPKYIEKLAYLGER